MTAVLIRLAAGALMACSWAWPGGCSGAAGAEPRLVGVFPSWGMYQRQFRVKDLESSGAADRLDVLIYAFATVGEDQRVAWVDPYADYDRIHSAAMSVDGSADSGEDGALHGHFNQLRKLKARHPQLRVELAIGGRTLSDGLARAAASAESRHAFAASCIERIIAGEFAPGLRVPGIFDGIDIDWDFAGEPGSAVSAQGVAAGDATGLLAELRAQLDRRGLRDGRRYLLSTTLPGDPRAAAIALADLPRLIDFINLRSFDLHGAWDGHTGLAAPLFSAGAAASGGSADASVRAYLAAGIPAGLLNLGVPFHGRGWQGVAAGSAGDGLGQPAGAGASGTFASGIDDDRILTLLPASSAVFRDAASGAMWRYDKAAGILWTYDDAVVLEGKMHYAAARRLGGVVCFDLSGDDAAGTLLAALHGARPPLPPVGR